MRKRTIRLLCSDADREALQELLRQLRARGLQVSQDASGKNDVVLAALSGSFYEDREKTDTLLGLIGAGAENVLPLQLDAVPIPDTVKNALYARNIIPAAGRDTAHTAERIAAAVPNPPSILPKLLIAGAVVLAAIIGLLIWHSRDGGPGPVETAPSDAIYIPEGWTEEDLAEIVDVIIVGEQMEFYTKDDVKDYQYPDWDAFAYRNWEDGGPRWYSREDGHEYSMTRYEDLRFLELMPNLRCLTLAQIEAGQLPELSKLSSLRDLMLMDCSIPDLEWVRGTSINKIHLLNSTGSVTDFSPLTGCAKLHEVHLDLSNARAADLRGFAPPALSWLWINSGNALAGPMDLSDLAACTRLSECQLENLPVTDLSFLSGAAGLQKLQLFNLPQLRDISALGGMAALKELQIEACDAIGDFGPVARCSALQRFSYRTWDYDVFRDASFLSDLPRLNDISLQNVNLPDVEFLRGIAAHQSSIKLDLTGEFDDYSALSAFSRYGRLNLDPGDGTPLADILPYLDGAQIQELCLRRFAEVDLSALPRASSRLELDRCGIRDLAALPADWKAGKLLLNKCASLRSLDGLQNQTAIRDLEIFNCPRLTEWNALEGMDLSSLSITGGFTVPEGIDFHASLLRFDSVSDLRDLSFLDLLDAEKRTSFELVGLDEVNNLQPLSRFHGVYLAVPPQLAEQAEDLVKAGNFGEYRIEYPQGGWDEEDLSISLLSLDELDTLPPALLRRVERVCLVGDALVDITQGEIWDEWSNGGPITMYQPWGSGEATPVKYGPGFGNVLEMLSPLTGLKELRLYRQPLRSLDGIQNFHELEEIQIILCDDLTDASAVFACPNLSFVRIDNCPITSIQGVQNLRKLDNLNINNTRVSDLSPLAACDFSAARERGGLELFINDLPVEDYAPLRGLPLKRLDINNTDAARYLPYLEGAPLRSFQACDSFMGRTDADDNALFADFVRSHPQLEYLNIAWNQIITDLSPVLELENLQELRVSSDMKDAIASLDGQNLRFRLEIED